MKVTNITDEARFVAALGVVVDAGESVEVDDDLAASLLDQPAVWAEEDQP
jgi:hypothetical protein